VFLAGHSRIQFHLQGLGERCGFAVKKANALSIALATGVVFAAATDFGHVRFFGVLAVFTAILAAFLGGTIARRMSALFVCFFRHRSRSLLIYESSCSSRGRTFDAATSAGDGPPQQTGMNGQFRDAVP
jgi:hypothetical protein